MIAQSDIQGRLRLLRYGLIVVVIVTFLVALLAQYAATSPLYDAAIKAGANGLSRPGITDNFGLALIMTVVVGVLAAIVYFAYQNVLQRTMTATK